MKRFLLIISLFLLGIMQNVNAQSFNKPKGYMGIIEIGGGIGIGAQPADRFGITMVNGYRFSPKFATGIGIGLQTFLYNSKTDWVLPLFAHFRSDFLDAKVSPFVACNVGYNFLLGQGTYDGFMIDPTVGVSLNSGQNNRWTFGVSLPINQVIVSSSSHDGDKIRLGLSAVNLKIGYSF